MSVVIQNIVISANEAAIIKQADETASSATLALHGV